MKTSPKIIAAIIREVDTFLEQSLGLHPASVIADLHDSALMIILKDILTQAEKESIGEKHIAELVSRNYIASYNAVRQILETKLTGIVGHAISHSSLFIDTQANCGTILCTVSA